MTKIKYFEANESEKFDIGDFVRIPQLHKYYSDIDNFVVRACDFGIITIQGNGFTVVRLDSGATYDTYPTIQALVRILDPTHITKPFTIYPESEDAND